MTTRKNPVATKSTEPGLSLSSSLAAQFTRKDAEANELRRRLDAQFAPRVGNPPGFESLPRDEDESPRRLVCDVATLAAYGFDEGDEGWCLPLLAELKALSGDAETSMYRLMMFGIFVAAGIANPGRSFKSIFGDRLKGWSLALPSDAAQRARSLDSLKLLFEALVDNDSMTAEHAMMHHLEGAQRISHRIGRPPPSLACPVTYLTYYGRIDGPEE